jgi:hypothetical protein
VLLFRRNGRECRVAQPVDGSTAAHIACRLIAEMTKLRPGDSLSVKEVRRHARRS